MGKIIKTIRCPNCTERGGDWNGDNGTVYEDGGIYCHACGYSSKEASKWVKGSIQSLEKSRGIDEITCKFYDYKIGRYTGTIGLGKDRRECKDEWVRIMEWRENGKVILQKIKTQFKEMKLIGRTDYKGLWGLDKFQLNDKIFVTITEGEEDALALAQVNSCQFPVVSAGGTKQALGNIMANLDKLQKAKYVVLAFDSDEAGKQAINQILAADVFEPGKVRIVEWPLKDANDMLKAGRKKEMIDLVLRAKIREPNHIVTVNQILDKVLEQPKMGIDMPWPTWTKWTYGLRFNEITTLVGPSGCGKTEIVKDIISHLLKQDINVGIFSFEQSPADTIRRYAGAKLGLKLQKPGEKWDSELISKTAMAFDNKIFLYDFNGKINIDDIFHSIRFMAKAKNCKYFVIDNLKSLKVVMKKEDCADFAVRLKALVKDLNIHMMLVSHVNKDSISKGTNVAFNSKATRSHMKLKDGDVAEIMNKFALDWENGRLPTNSNIEGGNDIEAISDYVILLGRNKVSPDDKIKRTIKLKLGKEGRIDSDNNKYCFELYRNNDGILEELDAFSCSGLRDERSLPF